MSIPDYMIVRTAVEQQMGHQVRDTSTADAQRPSRPEGPGRFATARRQLSISLRAIADRIEPRPMDPTPGTITGSAR